jgi:HlyD family secretion protein
MKIKIAFVIGIIILILGGWAFESRTPDKTTDIEYRYAAVETGELVKSISATGQVVALTAVDVKSKAGGIVVKLAVDEGSIVKKGDLIATIDPADTKAAYDQANADLVGANEKTSQAEKTYQLQSAQSKTEVADARATLETMKVRLERAQIQYKRQPTLSEAAVETAQANYNAEVSNLNRLSPADSSRSPNAPRRFRWPKSSRFTEGGSRSRPDEAKKPAGERLRGRLGSRKGRCSRRGCKSSFRHGSAKNEHA